MTNDEIEYFYNSAVALLNGALFYGRRVNTDNAKEVIAILYCLYLQSDQESKELVRERNLFIDDFGG